MSLRVSSHQVNLFSVSPLVMKPLFLKIQKSCFITKESIQFAFNHSEMSKLFFESGM